MKKKTAFWNAPIAGRALLDTVLKLDPRAQLKNPVMFIVYLSALLMTASVAYDSRGGQFPAFAAHIAAWLWLTVIFANFAEALAEGRGKARADSLRRSRKDAVARLLTHDREFRVPAGELKVNDVVVCEAGDVIPGDGEVIEGIASVDESAITGESAPVIRESGGDRSAVTSGTRVISDRILIRVTSRPGQTFLDRMISLIEGAMRQKTPNEISMTILLSSLTIIFIAAVMSLYAFAAYSAREAGESLSSVLSAPVLIALLVCLIPTTIGGLLSAIGISGMDRLLGRNVVVMSGRAIEAAGDVDVMLLDKTGTITLGNRMAGDLVPAPGISLGRLAEVSQLASLADETPEGRSIVVYVKENFNLRAAAIAPSEGTFIPFSAATRMSGLDLAAPGETRSIRKGAADAIRKLVTGRGGSIPPPWRRRWT